MMIFVIAAVTMMVLALAFALVLGWANVRFHVEQDPRIDRVEAATPGANCGGCGFAGCADFARAVVEGAAAPDGCPVGGMDTAKAIADILGIKVDESAPYRPVVHCNADRSKRLGLSDYRGESSCTAANVIGSVQGCTYGCLGFGDCAAACKYDAIHVVNGLAVVDYEKCIGCGACEKVCPRRIIQMIPFKSERMVVTACSSHDPGRIVRQVCKVGCLGCGLCHKMMDVFAVSDNVSRIDYERYSKDLDFTIPMEKCPMGLMISVGKPSTEDIAAVADEEVPTRITDKFKTTADDAQWRG